MKKNIAIIGGGPAGLMAAETIMNAGDFTVDVFDAMPTMGRKFLMAGKGGLNITHTDSFTTFLTRYGDSQARITPFITDFSPTALRAWVHQLGIDTFVGSSGRIFPQEMKAAPLLRQWLHRMRESGIRFHPRHHWHSESLATAELIFTTPQGTYTHHADAVVLALGGGSWAKLGATGAWVTPFLQHKISVHELMPSNCGFNSPWSAYFQDHFAGQAVKNCSLSLYPRDHDLSKFHSGEFMLTRTGVEGSLIYALSPALRQQLSIHGVATIYLDLLPHYALAHVQNRVSGTRGKLSLANFLRKRLGLEGVKAALLRECVPLNTFSKADDLAHVIKSLPIQLLSTRPLDEAISSAGGVCFSGLTENLMIPHFPGVFCAGEMLDWDAPTGGYLLTACFATGRAAGLGVVSWLT